jgi:hypothetical protein
MEVSQIEGTKLYQITEAAVADSKIDQLAAIVFNAPDTELMLVPKKKIR